MDNFQILKQGLSNKDVLVDKPLGLQWTLSIIDAMKDKPTSSKEVLSNIDVMMDKLHVRTVGFAQYRYFDKQTD